MAERRMFAKTIIDSDAFLDMPLSTQALYFHLNMRADDDGFVNNPKRIQRVIGCSEDDLKILIAKSFVIAFDDGVVVIKHWRINNYLQSDRKKDTVYIEDAKLLGVKKNKSYTLKSDTNDECIQDVYKTDTQNSIGKNSIDNNIYIDNNISCISTQKTPQKSVRDDVENTSLNQQEEDFKKIYAIYPKKVGKAAAFSRYQKWISKSGYRINGRTYHLTNKQIWLAVKRYVDNLKEKETDLQYYKGFDVLMGSCLLDYVEDESDGEDSD